MKPNYKFQDKIVSGAITSLRNSGKALIACAPSAGKTNMAIRVITELLKKGDIKRVVVLTHGQVVIRQQWQERFESLGTKIISQEIKKAKDSISKSTKVLFALPQTAVRMDLKADLIVVDEAHQRFTKEEMNSVISRVKPKMLLALTGTPSSVAGLFTEDQIHFVTLLDLIGYGVTEDIDVELHKYEYNLTERDYKGDEVSGRYKHAKKDTQNTIESLLNRISGKTGVRKTMITCRDKKHAKEVGAALTKRGVKNIVSVSGDGSGSGNDIRVFKRDGNIRCLIVVYRGILGFDFPDLEVIVDMSGSHNPDRLFQLMCRVVRRPHNKKLHKKLFLKMTSESVYPITYTVMSFVVAQSHEDYYFADMSAKNKSVPVSKEFKTMLASAKKSKIAGGASFYNVSKFPRLLTFKEFGSKHGLAAKTSMREVRNFMTERGKEDWSTYSEKDIRALLKKEGITARWQLKSKEGGLYQYLRKNGKLDVYLKSILTDWSIYSEKDIRALLKKEGITTRKQLMSKEEGLYKYLRKNGKLDVYLKSTRTGWSTYSEKDIRALLKKEGIATRGQLKSKEEGLYQYLRKNGKLDVYLKSTRTDWSTYSEKDIRALLKKEGITTRWQLESKGGGLYQYLRKNGKLDLYLPKNKNQK